MKPISLASIYASLVLALLLHLLPWAGFGLMIRPNFVLLVSVYWVLRAPYLFNIGSAWGMGLLLDLADGTIFGQHALAFGVAAFFAAHYQRRLALFNIWQQAAYVLFLILLNQSILLILQLFSGGEFPGWSYYLPCLTGILLWQMLILSPIGIEPPPHRSRHA